MNVSDSIVALILGVIEGITEYLPVSSTGHLILFSHLFGQSGARIETFTIFIQSGSILGVCLYFRQRLLKSIVGVCRADPAELHFAKLIIVATLPAVVFGFSLHRLIKQHLFSSLTVAIALIIGGIVIILIERMQLVDKIKTIEKIQLKHALLVGFGQTLALFPGVSRSAATIMSARLLGLSRQSATEFSFYLAIPVVIGASGLDLVRSLPELSIDDAPFLAIGFTAAFFTTLLVIRWLLNYVAKHTFAPFGWYRIVLGVVVLAILQI